MSGLPKLGGRREIYQQQMYFCTDYHINHKGLQKIEEIERGAVKSVGSPGLYNS